LDTRGEGTLNTNKRACSEKKRQKADVTDMGYREVENEGARTVSRNESIAAGILHHKVEELYSFYWGAKCKGKDQHKEVKIDMGALGAMGKRRVGQHRRKEVNKIMEEDKIAIFKKLRDGESTMRGNRLGERRRERGVDEWVSFLRRAWIVRCGVGHVR